MSRAWVPSLVVLILLAAAPAAVAIPALPVVSVCASGCDRTTIQGGVDIAAAGGTVNVGAGTYVEQVDIDKNLTLQGVGSGSTVVQAPASLAANATTMRPVVTVRGGHTVAISKLTVDGANRGNTGLNDKIEGIQFYDASGSVTDTAVKRVQDTGTEGVEGRHGIHVLVDDASAQNVAITRATITEYGRNGVRVEGAGASATVTDSTVTGAGPVPSAARNGIVFLDDSAGSATHNTVTANECDNDPNCGDDLYGDDHNQQSYGLFVQNSAADVTLADNTVTGNDTGIYLDTSLSGTTTSITGNTITGNRQHGIVTTGGELVATGNTFSGSRYALVALGYEENPDGEQPHGTFTGNTISGMSLGGLWFQTDDPATPGSAIAMHDNRFPASGVAVRNETSASQDATGNWWGSNAGAGGGGSSSTTGPVNTGSPLQLTLGASPTTVAPLGTSTLAASLGSAAFPTASIGFAKASGGGSVAPGSAGTSAGAASSTYTADASAGTADLTASLDNQTVHVTVTTAASGPPRDPLAPGVVKQGLLTKFPDPSLDSKSGSVSFTDTILEPGTILYGLDLTFYRPSGGARAAAAKKPIHIGNLSRTITAPGKIKVTIPIGTKGKRYLKRHKKAKLVVRAYFVSAVEKSHVNTSRGLPVKGRVG